MSRLPGVAWAPAPEGVMVTVRLTPKGGRDSVDGVETLADGSTVLKARVRAAPHEGAANDALCRLLAKAVGVPPRAVAILSGATSRIKRVKIVGENQVLMSALEKISGAG